MSSRRKSSSTRRSNKSILDPAEYDVLIAKQIKQRDEQADLVRRSEGYLYNDYDQSKIEDHKQEIASITKRIADIQRQRGTISTRAAQRKSDNLQSSIANSVISKDKGRVNQLLRDLENQRKEEEARMKKESSAARTIQRGQRSYTAKKRQIEKLKREMQENSEKLREQRRQQEEMGKRKAEMKAKMMKMEGARKAAAEKAASAAEVDSDEEADRRFQHSRKVAEPARTASKISEKKIDASFKTQRETGKIGRLNIKQEKGELDEDVIRRFRRPDYGGTRRRHKNHSKKRRLRRH